MINYQQCSISLLFLLLREQQVRLIVQGQRDLTAELSIVSCIVQKQFLKLHAYFYLRRYSRSNAFIYID